jgi:hypothetical protein
LGVRSVRSAHDRRDPARQPFADWLEAQRRARGVETLGDLARASGVSQSLISRYLACEISPRRRNVKRLAAWAEVDPQLIWALIPEEGGPGLAATPAPADVAARVLALEAEARALRAAVAPPPAASGPLTTQPGQDGTDELTQLLRTDDLDTPAARPAVPRGSVLWLDPDRPPRVQPPDRPVDAVLVAHRGAVYARLLDDDGVTLYSAVAGAVALRLDDPDVRVIGVVNHTQQAR